MKSKNKHNVGLLSIIFEIIIALYYFIFKYCLFIPIKWVITSLLNNSKEKKITNVPNNKNNLNNVPQLKSFSCEIIIDDYKYECDSLINSLLYFDEIDKEDLYDGYSRQEIIDYGDKVYEYNNHEMPCEIISNYENEHYEIVYNEHSNDYYFGYIPTKYNDEIYDIINNKKNIKGGLIAEGGRYKLFDEITEKIIKGKDEYKLFIKLYYED